MNNDNFRDRNDMDNQRGRRGQQFGPGSFPNQPEFPDMQNQPRTAPPNFTPELPESERGLMGGPEQFGTQFGPQFGPQFGYDRRRRPRDFRSCLYRFTFIWLDNGNSFWFYPVFAGGQFVQGFRWRRNRWEFDRINIRRIFYFRCY